MYRSLVSSRYRLSLVPLYQFNSDFCIRMYAHEYFRGVFAVYQCKTLSDGVCKGEVYSNRTALPKKTLAYMTSSPPEPLGIF